MHLQDLTQELGDLALDGHLPIARRQVAGDSLQSSNVEPVLLGAVGEPIVELGIRSDLERDPLLDVTVIVLEISESVIMNSNSLTDLNELNI